MKFNRTFRITAFAIGALTVIVLLTWAFVQGRKESLAEQERERPVKPPSRVHSDEERVAVVLDSVEQVKAGIIIETVSPTTYQQQLKVFATVVPVQQIADAFQQYSSAKAQSAKAKATVAVSQKEYLRIKELYERKLESDKTLQASESQWQSDDASAQSAESVLRSLESSVRQQWGETIAQWIFNGSENLTHILKNQEALIEVTLSSGETLSPIPRTAVVQSSTNEKSFVNAHFVSSAQSADAQFQGTILFYVAPSSHSLLGGMNVNVFLPTSTKLRGVIVQHSAGVWWQGKAWMYVKKGSISFVRFELPTDEPAQGGWFVSQDKLGVSFPVHIVTRGAQLLLSEEFRSQIQVGEEGEKK